MLLTMERVSAKTSGSPKRGIAKLAGAHPPVFSRALEPKITRRRGAAIRRQKAEGRRQKAEGRRQKEEV